MLRKICERISVKLDEWGDGSGRVYINKKVASFVNQKIMRIARKIFVIIVNKFFEVYNNIENNFVIFVIFLNFLIFVLKILVITGNISACGDALCKPYSLVLTFQIGQHEYKISRESATVDRRAPLKTRNLYSRTHEKRKIRGRKFYF